MSKTQNQSNYSKQSQSNVKNTVAQSELEENTDVTGAKPGKTRTSEARLVLLLIGWESGANFVNQSQSVVKQNQSKREITFDTQLKHRSKSVINTATSSS